MQSIQTQHVPLGRRRPPQWVNFGFNFLALYYICSAYRAEATLWATTFLKPYIVGKKVQPTQIKIKIKKVQPTPFLKEPPTHQPNLITKIPTFDLKAKNVFLFKKKTKSV